MTIFLLKQSTSRTDCVLCCASAVSWAVFVAVFLAIPLLAPPAIWGEEAQQAEQKKTDYAELAVDKSEVKKEKKEIRNILRRKEVEINKNTIALLDNFFRRYYFAQMTTLSKLGALPDYRMAIKETCESTAGKSEAMEAMNRLTSSMMHAICNGVLDATGGAGKQQVIVLQESVRDENDNLRVVLSVTDLESGDRIFDLAGNLVNQAGISRLERSSIDFHPAVKLNAMLVLGDLNDKQPKRKEKAIPRVNTQRDLIAYLESAENLSDVLLVGALDGMQRHIHDQLDINRKKRIAKVVAPIVSGTAVSGRDEVVAVWIRRQAIDLLGQIGIPGAEKSEYVKKLYQVISNQDDLLPVRIAAAQAISKMNLSNLQPKAVEVLVQSLTQLAVDACESELVDELGQNRNFSAARLRMRLMSVRQAAVGDIREASDEDEQGAEQALGGLMAVALETEQDALQKLIGELQSIDTRVGTLNADSGREQVESLLKKSISSLNRLIQAEPNATKKPTPPQTAEKQ